MFKKIRFLFNIIVILFVFFVVAFSLYKIIHSNKKTFPDDKKYIGYNIIDIHWEKNNYIVPTNNILLADNSGMVAGEYYYVEQSLQTMDGNEKCFMGFFKTAIHKKKIAMCFSRQNH